MTVEPSFQVGQYWEWQYDDGYPYQTNEDKLPELTETGAAVDTPITGSNTSSDIPNGGSFDYNFDLSPNVQHFEIQPRRRITTPTPAKSFRA